MTAPASRCSSSAEQRGERGGAKHAGGNDQPPATGLGDGRDGLVERGRVKRVAVALGAERLEVEHAVGDDGAGGREMLQGGHVDGGVERTAGESNE